MSALEIYATVATVATFSTPIPLYGWWRVDRKNWGGRRPMSPKGAFLIFSGSVVLLFLVHSLVVSIVAWFCTRSRPSLVILVIHEGTVGALLLILIGTILFAKLRRRD